MGIPVNYFTGHIRLCVFIFDGDYLKQINGIAMGNSLSLVLVNLPYPIKDIPQKNRNIYSKYLYIAV